MSKFPSIISSENWLLFQKKEVYINLLDQKEPKLNLESKDIPDIKLNNQVYEIKNIQRKVIKISEEELELHKKFVKNSLQKNFFK